MDKEIIYTCKYHINNNDNDTLISYINHLTETNTQSQESDYRLPKQSDYRLPYEYIFQQVYLHACLKKNTYIAQWLKEEIYEKQFDIIQKTALRQMFIYGNYLLNKGT